MRIKENPVVAVLDSRVAISIITKSLAKKLKLKANKPFSIVVVTADSTRIWALGIIEKASLTILYLSISTTLQIINSKDDTLLLGTDWFTQTNAVLNFKTNKVHLQYSEQEVEVSITV